MTGDQSNSQEPLLEFLAKADFITECEGEMALKKGNIVFAFESEYHSTEDGWVKALKKTTGEIGYVPQTYIKKTDQVAQVSPSSLAKMIGSSSNQGNTTNMSSSTPMDEVNAWLKSIKLEKFSKYFEENGYDDLSFILELQDGEIRDLAKESGMKKGHYLKFKKRIEEHQHHGGNEVITQQKLGTKGFSDASTELKPGTRVETIDGFYGTIRYAGTPEGYNFWYGIELDNQSTSSHGDGTFHGIRCFQCEENKALFLTPKQVRKSQKEKEVEKVSEVSPGALRAIIRAQSKFRGLITRKRGKYALLKQVNTRDDYNFKDIDRYSLKTPKSKTKSVNDLADYLAAGAKRFSNGEDEEAMKARAAYRWVTANISYDTKAFFGGKYPSQDAKTTLRNRSSVCAGYAYLFEALTKGMGLESKTLAGRCKGYGFKQGSIPKKRTHAWSAVKINGHWYLSDCCWGSGHINSGRHFQFSYSDFYFMTPPEQFVAGHYYDEEPEMMLLKEPLSVEDWAKRVSPSKTFFDHNLTCHTHTEAVIDNETGSLRVTFGVPKEVKLLIHHAIGGEKAHNKISIEGDKTHIDLKFHKKGDYQLDVFSKRGEKERNYNHGIKYIIKAKKAYEGEISSPPKGMDVGQGFFENEIKLISHKTAKISTPDGHLKIKLQIKECNLLVNLIDAQNKKAPTSTTLVSPNTYEIRAICPRKGKYSLNVFAKKKNSSKSMYTKFSICMNIQYKYFTKTHTLYPNIQIFFSVDLAGFPFMFSYNIQAAKGDPKAGFPTTYSAPTDYVLLAPMQSPLKKGGSYNFKVKFPNTESATFLPGWTKMNKVDENGNFEFSCKIPTDCDKCYIGYPKKGKKSVTYFTMWKVE
eukprot:g2359.t1